MKTNLLKCGGWLCPFSHSTPLSLVPSSLRLVPLLQWKSILMLMLGCEEAALHSHPAAFTELLRVVRLQLQATLGDGGPPTGSGGKKEHGGEADVEPGQAPFGIPLVEELLPDSFLRKMFGSFFQMLQVGRMVLKVDKFK